MVDSRSCVGVDFVIDVGVFDDEVAVLVLAVEHEEGANEEGDGEEVELYKFEELGCDKLTFSWHDVGHFGYRCVNV